MLAWDSASAPAILQLHEPLSCSAVTCWKGFGWLEDAHLEHVWVFFLDKTQTVAACTLESQGWTLLLLSGPCVFQLADD